MPGRDSAKCASQSRDELRGACLGVARLNYSWRYVRDASSHARRPPGAEGRYVRDASSHARRPPGAEGVYMSRWVCGYWLSVHYPAYLFTHSAVDRPVHVGKQREDASSLLCCWDFEAIFVHSPDFDRLFVWAVLRTAGPLDQQRQPCPVPTGQG